MSNNQTVKTAPWDAADLLDSPEAIAAYLDAAVEEAEGDPSFLLVALDTVARAGNFSELAREIGISRKGLYKALSEDGNPSFATIWALLSKLGVRIEFHALA
jgi:probable addiction module antidote protein